MFSLAFLFLLTLKISARQISMVNQCGTTIWPGMHTGAGTTPSHATGWQMAPGSNETFEVPDNWTAARIWARTGCSIINGMFQCLTGSCGKGPVGAGLNGDMTCYLSDMPPATLAEFTLIPGGTDNYDVSLVDGFNIPLRIIPSTDCDQPMCETNINDLCPPLLRTSIDAEGRNLACLSACNAGFGQELYGNRACCSGGYNNPTACAICGVDYYDVFKNSCRTSYAYAYDEKSGTALYTCPAPQSAMPDYQIVFCPFQTDYVGSSISNRSYASDTATCSSMITSFSTTFSVGPSPTTTNSNSLPITATVAPGIDGATAYQLNGTSSSTSSTKTSSSSGSKPAGSTGSTCSTSTSTSSSNFTTSSTSQGIYHIEETQSFAVSSTSKFSSNVVSNTSTNTGSSATPSGAAQAAQIVLSSHTLLGGQYLTIINT